MKQKTVSLSVVILILSPIMGLGQMQRKENDIYFKRIKAQKQEDLDAWREALKTATEVRPDRTYFLLIFPLIDGLWKEDIFQEAISKKYVARVLQISEQRADDWRKALEKACEKSYPDRGHYWIITMAQQDRLFVGTEFQAEEFKKLLRRLSTIPKDAILQWHEVPLWDSEVDSAISLLKLDELFVRDVFQQTLFTKTLSQAKATKKS